MSGGCFDGVEYKMMNAAEELEEILKNSDNQLYPTDQRKAMERGLNILKLATIYLRRIDWYVSGDDGDETFLERLSDDIREYKLSCTSKP